MRIKLAALVSLAFVVAAGCSSAPCNKNSDCDLNEVCQGRLQGTQTTVNFFEDGGAYTCNGNDCGNSSSVQIVDTSDVDHVNCLPTQSHQGDAGSN